MSVETPYTAPAGLVPEDPAEDAFPRSYGKYILLHRLARGGMGNVFLAKTGEMMGIEKHCVVKTLRAQFTHDPEYVQRFIDEARVVVQLSHRNICPVFDVGRVGPSFYLAMELVLGRDARSLVNALKDRGKDLPEACALHIACEMLDALDYAHRHVDETTGEPLHLVHRDVSPQNVMINIEGEVKLIDFGLAERGHAIKDDEPHQHTGATTVMGKTSYMAPEHARGEIVDARADQFSAAVVIYELLVGDRYYAGLNPQQIWQQAGAGVFRPADLSKLAPTLRAILERALSPSREERYPTCGDLREAILDYERGRDIHADARDLRTLMSGILGEELKEMRDLLKRFAHVSRVARPGFIAVGSADVFSIATSSHASTIHDPTEVIPRSGSFIAPRPPSRAPLFAAAAGFAALVVGVAALVVHNSRGDDVDHLVVVEHEADPPVPAPLPPAAPATPLAEPVAAPDPPKGAAKKPKKRRPAAQASAVELAQHVKELKARCPALACTPAAVAGFGRMAAVSVAEVAQIKEAIEGCYEQCKK